MLLLALCLDPSLFPIPLPSAATRRAFLETIMAHSPPAAGSRPEPTLSFADRRRTELQNTPHRRGSATRALLDTTGQAKYQKADYDDYVKEDLRTHRVFVDVEQFMRVVLRLPEDWRTSLKDVVERVRGDAAFSECLFAYRTKCNQPGPVESKLYALRADMNNRAMEVIEDHYKSQPLIRYYRNDPQKLYGGVLNKKNLSPDLLELSESMFTSSGNVDNVESQGPKKYPFWWFNTISVEEIKDRDVCLHHGDGSFRPLDPEGTSYCCDITPSSDCRF